MADTDPVDVVVGLLHTLGDPTLADVGAAMGIEVVSHPLPVHTRGITFSFLVDFLARCTGSDGDPNASTKFDPWLNTYSLVDAVKQATARWNCSVAELAAALDKVNRNSEENRRSLFHKPTHFMSYAWSYPLIDVVEAARTVTKSEGDDWGLWLDILAINQHQGDRTQVDLAAINTCISEIGKMVLVIDARALALTRVWCIYEIMVAVRAGAEIDVVFIGKHRSAFDSAIIGLTILAGRFDNVDVREAAATEPLDKTLILTQVASDPGLDELRLLGTIEEAGGWESMLVTDDAEREAFEKATAAGDTAGMHENWRPKYIGELDPDMPLYKKLHAILQAITFGRFETYADVLAAIAPPPAVADVAEVACAAEISTSSHAADADVD